MKGFAIADDGYKRFKKFDKCIIYQWQFMKDSCYCQVMFVGSENLIWVESSYIIMPKEKLKEKTRTTPRQ